MAGRSLTRKNIEGRLVEGAWRRGEDIAIRVDKVLMQDATGVPACLQFEQIVKPVEERVDVEEESRDGLTPLLQFEEFGLDEVQVPFAIQYVDHNVLQIDERNADDHAFLRTFCKRYGIWFSPLGNGICHYQFIERFAEPGTVELGADSHTTSGGAMGAFALGVGGLDIATTLAGHPFWFRTPSVVQVRLQGQLEPWVSAKDVVLELLRRYRVNWGIEVAGAGGVMVLEFTGPGVRTLNMFQRMTIANMAAEMNATAMFPSDERTREFLRIQRREDQFVTLEADEDARYDLSVEIDLSSMEPLIACPWSPDNVVPVREVEGTPVAQVCVGSSVNSGYEDMAIVAKVLRGRELPSVGTPQGERLLQLIVTPGSRQITNVLTRKGLTGDLMSVGALFPGSICGWCVGMGGAPASGTNSVRTGPRNFPGRSGTKDDKVYLASPETAAATALFGRITDPRTLGEYPDLGLYDLEDGDFTDYLLMRPLPRKDRSMIGVIRGPHIIPPPRKEELGNTISGEAVAKFGDDISTGSISPDGPNVMGKRQNIGDLAIYTFEKEMPAGEKGVIASKFYNIAMRAKRESGGGFIFAGQNYGQGSSREVAAMVMVELGIHAVSAKSFPRIHRDNLIKQGILPLFISEELYEAIEWRERPEKGKKQLPFVREGQIIVLPRLREELASQGATVTLRIGDHEFHVEHRLNERERNIILAGGLINYLKTQTK